MKLPVQIDKARIAFHGERIRSLEVDIQALTIFCRPHLADPQTAESTRPPTSTPCCSACPSQSSTFSRPACQTSFAWRFSSSCQAWATIARATPATAQPSCTAPRASQQGPNSARSHRSACTATKTCCSCAQPLGRIGPPADTCSRSKWSATGDQPKPTTGPATSHVLPLR